MKTSSSVGQEEESNIFVGAIIQPVGALARLYILKYVT
jgi:hypothetical protein